MKCKKIVIVYLPENFVGLVAETAPAEITTGEKTWCGVAKTESGIPKVMAVDEFKSYSKIMYFQQKPKLLIKANVLTEILRTVGSIPPETGGILGCNEQDTVSHFLFDHTGKFEKTCYVPNNNFLNYYIRNNWARNNIRFCGFVHSHPADATSLSLFDIEYGMNILQNFDNLSQLLLILVNPNKPTEKITFYSLLKVKDNKPILYQYQSKDTYILK